MVSFGSLITNIVFSPIDPFTSKVLLGLVVLIPTLKPSDVNDAFPVLMFQSPSSAKSSRGTDQVVPFSVSSKSVPLREKFCINSLFGSASASSAKSIRGTDQVVPFSVISRSVPLREKFCISSLLGSASASFTLSAEAALALYKLYGTDKNWVVETSIKPSPRSSSTFRK